MSLKCWLRQGEVDKKNDQDIGDAHEDTGDELEYVEVVEVEDDGEDEDDIELEDEEDEDNVDSD